MCSSAPTLCSFIDILLLLARRNFAIGRIIGEVMMNKQSERKAVSSDAADHSRTQTNTGNAGVSTLPKSAAGDGSRRIVHGFTLHARSNVETKEASQPTLTDVVASAPLNFDASPQVRYKKRIAHPMFCQLGNTWDMAGQLG